MKEILVTSVHKQLVEEYAPRQTFGGYSNLKTNDLNKASRKDFNVTGLYGESALYQYRYGSIEKLTNLLDKKNENFKNTGRGDDGFDDEVMYEGQNRFIDIKTSHVDSFDKIKNLNLVIPQRELHQNMIYIAAFTIGSDKADRFAVDRVILSGWCLTEDIKDRWYYDANKFAVKIPNLRPMEDLDKWIK